MNQALAYSYETDAPACSSKYLLPVLRRVLAGVPERAHVLDLGCGNGALTAGLARPGWDVRAFDCSRAAIDIARASYPGIRFQLGDATEPLDLTPGRFDLVLAVEVIEHVLNPRGLLRNAYAALRPGGALVVTTPYHGYWKNLTLALLGRMDAHWDPLWDAGHVKFFSRATLSLLLAETGFSGLRFTGAGRVPGLWKSMVLAADRPPAASHHPPRCYGVECES
ncbi:MAG TPA: class I SAM-dependent methyltransferase [Bryobacteraceae bacterium]